MTTGSIQHNIARWYQTVRHLKWPQISYRLWYPLKKVWYREKEANARAVAAALDFPQCSFPVWPHQRGIYQPESRSFLLLNIRHAFGLKIDWDYKAYGLLWTYHLNYFDWLRDPELSVSDRLDTIWAYLDAEADVRVGRDAYPASLRISNWIHFLSTYQIKEERIVRSLYRQSMRLHAFPEFQLQGNHLLENGITLIGILTFFDRECAADSVNIAFSELQSQILPDGAHFERSIRYHAALLQRIFDLIILVRQREIYELAPLYKLLNEKAALMYAWLEQMQFGSGAYPCFGDCSPEDCPDPVQMATVAQNLIGTPYLVQLQESGYRKQVSGAFELFFNIGKISPDFQPGHAHADLFSFCLEYQGQPLIVDTGISTYDTCERRAYERSTAAHNTVSVAGENSSDVWRSFRVGRRASPRIIEDTAWRIVAAHDGYLQRYGVTHQRSIDSSGGRISIEDRLKGNGQTEAACYLHFAPGLEPEPDGQGGMHIRALQLRIRFDGLVAAVETYEYCTGFNKRTKAKRIKGVLIATTAKTIIEQLE